MCKPQDFEDARGVERLLSYHARKLSRIAVLDANKKIQAYDQNKRRSGEVIGDYIATEQRAFREITETLVRNSRSEKSGERCHDHRATSVNSSVCSEAEYDMVEDEDAFVEAPWRQKQTGHIYINFSKCTSTKDLRERDTEEAGVLEGAAQFMLQNLTLNCMLSNLHTASREMHLSWR